MPRFPLAQTHGANKAAPKRPALLSELIPVWTTKHKRQELRWKVITDYQRGWLSRLQMEVFSIKRDLYSSQERMPTQRHCQPNSGNKRGVFQVYVPGARVYAESLVKRSQAEPKFFHVLRPTTEKTWRCILEACTKGTTTWTFIIIRKFCKCQSLLT